LSARSSQASSVVESGDAMEFLDHVQVGTIDISLEPDAKTIQKK
jgi:hypothetical protein